MWDRLTLSWKFAGSGQEEPENKDASENDDEENEATKSGEEEDQVEAQVASSNPTAEEEKEEDNNGMDDAQASVERQVRYILKHMLCKCGVDSYIYLHIIFHKPHTYAITLE